MPSRRKIAPSTSLLALTLALLLASVLAWACGPAAPAAQEGEGAPAAEAEPTATPTPTPTPESDVTDDLEYVALAVYRLAEQEQNRGASGAGGASGASSGPQLPDRIYVHITAWTEAVDDLERMLRDNGATDISVIKDGKVSIVESQAPPGLLPEITRHLAFLHAFTSGIYPNMERGINDALTMYAGGIFTEAETARRIMGNLYFPEYPKNIIVKVELDAPESYASVRDFLASEGAFPHDIEPGASWFYAGVPVSIMDDLYSYQGVIYIDNHPRYGLNVIEPTSTIPSPEVPQVASNRQQGARVHGALAWHPSNTGQNVAMGIIDNGFMGFAAQMGTELPRSVHYSCYNQMTGVSKKGTGTPDPATCAITSNHGTMVAEAVYDIAPGSMMYISNDYINKAADWMTDNGVKIINYSLHTYWDGPGNGTSKKTGSSLNIVKEAVSDGALWVNAAGNHAEASWFKRNMMVNQTTSGDFVRFDGTDDCNNVSLEADKEYAFQLRWHGAWDSSNHDLSVQIWRNERRALPDGTSIATLVRQVKSSNPQRRSSQQGGVPADTDPYDWLPYTPTVSDTDYCLRVQVPRNAIPSWIQVQLYHGNSTLEHTGDGESIVQPGDSREAGMLTVGAAGWNTPNSIRDYSSVGPTRDGRIKPDVVGADGAYASVLGKSGFGTSQAAAHISGLAALAARWFSSAGVSYTPASLARYVKDNATRLSGQSANSWGDGFVKLPCPSKFVSLSGTAINSSWNNADCVSARRTAAGRGYTNNKVDFYTFTLTRTTTVHIDLVSSRDAYLYLINGLNTGGTAFRLSDDNGGYGSTDARIRARLPAGTYTVAATTRASGQTGSYRLRIANIPRASLSPAPSSVAFRADGRWWEFTVDANVPVKVVANPGSVTKRVEITSFSTSRNYCPPEQNDSVYRGSGQAIRLAGCVAGNGKVQLRDALDNRLLATYTFTISRAATTRTSRAGTTSTPAPVVQLQCLSISSIAGSRASSGTFVYLSWRNPTGGKSVSGRQIDIRKWVGGSNGQWNFERYITVGRTATSAYHIGTAPASYYAYRIRSQCAGSSNSGWSSWKLVAPHSGASGSSDGASQEPEPTPGASAPPDDDARHDPPEDVVQPASEANTGPSQPSGLTAAYADGAVTLSWTPGSSPRYVKQVVKRRERGVRPEVWTDFELDVAANTYTDATVAAGKTYIYRVKGLRDNGRGGDSNRATVTIP